MDGKDSVLAVGRRHIIRRPRLTRLLDECTTRIILLVAPAGYGKTTLAHEWLEERPHGWYRGGPASADVAALSVGVAEALTAVVPDAGGRMRERLRATETPERDVRPLAELLAEDLHDWPEDAWLAFDDYHFAMESRTAEEFVDLVSSLCPIRLLIASRRRPSWASARRILYGELYELGTNALAMSQEEASEVLARGKREGEGLPGLIALVEGWPAVIGLAALAEESTLPEDDLPSELYDFFAEELYQAADPALRSALRQLAVAPSITSELAEFLLGANEADATLQEGVRLGFFDAHGRGSFELHPLLRTFLEAKFREGEPRAQAEVVATVGHFLIERERWDDAFCLVERFSAADVLVSLVEAALPTLLLEGRLATLTRWLDYAQGARIDSAVLDLAAAERSIREAQYRKAEALALQAANSFEPDHVLSCRAFYVAGEAAHMAERDEIAIGYHKTARKLARGPSDVRNALWGQFVSAATLERPDSVEILTELESLHDTSSHGLLRLASARAILGTRIGTLKGVVGALQVAAPLLQKATDPMVRTSFLTAYAHALSLGGLYERAIPVAEQEIHDAEYFRLPFVTPHAYMEKALAEIGLRRFPEASALINYAERAGIELDDVHIVMNSHALQARLHLAQGCYHEALAAIEADWEHLPSRTMYAEYLATRALVFSCAERHAEGLELARLAEQLTRGIEAGVLCSCVQAIVALREESIKADELTEQALEKARSTANFDGFVAAYRAHPPLLYRLAAKPNRRHTLIRILARARDHRLANGAGLQLPTGLRKSSHARLSKRELEVYELLGQGLSNKEIARLLFISEVTVKVHVRHIFDKLGVRTRTQAALHALAQRDT